MFPFKKIRVVHQLSQNECGAACLSMIMQYHGESIPLRKISEQCGTSRDGVTIFTLKKVAEGYGYKCNVYRANIEYLMNDAKLPAILYWNNSHYVVLEKIDNKKAIIIDPAHGRKSIMIDELDSCFSNVIISLEPLTPKKLKHKDTSWKDYTKYIFVDPKLTVFIFLLSIVIQLVGLVTPFFTQFLVDEVLVKNQRDILNSLGLIILLIFVTFFLFTYLRTYLSVKLQVLISKSLSTDFICHLFKLPIGFFEQRTTGDLITRMNNITTIRELLARSGSAVILDLMMVFGYGAVMLYYSTTLAFITFGIALLQLVIMIFTLSKVQELTNKELETLSTTQGYLTEALRAITFVKTSGTEEGILKKWSSVFEQQMKIVSKRGTFTGFLGSIIGSISTIAPLTLLWLGAKEVMNGQLTIGTLVAFNGIAMSFLGPIGSLVTNIQSFQYIKGVFERLQDVLKADIEKTGEKSVNQNLLEKEIKLEKVSFSFSQEHPPVIKDLNLTINPGEKVSIVGSTGSGKTTLTKLILGLYKTTNGTIRYGDFDVDDLKVVDLRKKMGIVLQDTLLFNDTIAKNISYFEDISMEKIGEAARIAGLHLEIEKMPMGYNTIIGENGQNLSGGQRQRLAIARALVREPSLIILDEATSQLDTVTEQNLHSRLDSLHVTRIVIAHRLITVMDSDQIVVMDEGVIKEMGNHEELMKIKGMYYRLFKKQMDNISEHVPENSSLTS